MLSKFPRFTEYEFQIRPDTYLVPNKYAGRLDLIAEELFGQPMYYKAIAAANNLRKMVGTRYGIRPVAQAVRNELYREGLRGTILDGETSDIVRNMEMSEYTWKNYFDTYEGFASDVYAGRYLMIPTLESATRWMQMYGWGDEGAEEDNE